jgi:hypothetical protein
MIVSEMAPAARRNVNFLTKRVKQRREGQARTPVPPRSYSAFFTFFILSAKR